MKYQALLHKFFGSARLELQFKDRFGCPVEPREWFLLPLSVIDEAIQKLMEGSIGNFRYDPPTASGGRALTPLRPSRVLPGKLSNRTPRA